MVTLDSKQLSVGFVQFVPDRSKGTIGPPAVGQIGADGRFELRTARKLGALAGSHKVKIVALEESGDPNIPPMKPLIPMHYFNHKTSNVRAFVKAGQVNKIDIRLSSEPPVNP